MERIGHYELIEKLDFSKGIISYKAKNGENNQRVILKTVNHSFNSLVDQECLMREYEVATTFPSKGIPVYYGMESIGGRPVLILEDFGGLSLRRFIEIHESSLTQFFEIGIKITEILEEIHQRNIVHKNLNIYNIWYNSSTGEIKLMDFAISSYLTREKKKVMSPARIEGNLEYISPEQTGRMNRIIDHRSDLYSLGVILYELITGNKPFYSFDSMELVHFHIAKTPVPPHLVNASIPVIVSQIILKLMSKNAEDRYNSASGVKKDLIRCRKEYTDTGKISLFRLGQFDYSTKLQIPEKLYGREEEMTLLWQIFQKASEGASSIVFIEGPSGVGKSVLVQEIHKPVTEKRGYFLEGKYNQFNTNTPYYAFISAFKDLVDLLLSEAPGTVAKWKNSLKEALGTTGKVLTEVIPNLELLIGKQPEIPHLPPSETQNRFNYVCRKFIKAVAKKEHPMVIFIDDIQWADKPSFELIKNLMLDRENNYFLLIIAYRKNEYGSTHLLQELLEELLHQQIAYHSIRLGNLSYPHVLHLISESLKMNAAQVADIAQLIFQKTQGNAFFVNEFLKSLYDDGLLHFDNTLSCWIWSLNNIEGRNITENVVDLMAEKILRLPVSTQTILKYASCLGSTFSYRFIQTITPLTSDQLHQDLQQALSEGLIIARGDDYKFSHDRVHQAVYTLNSLETRNDFHYRIGKDLMEKLSRNELEEHIFDVANQFKISIDAAADKDRIILLELFLRAGKRAKSSAAFKPSLEYLQCAVQLHESILWKKQYSLCIELFSEAAESAYLCGDHHLMEKWVDTVLHNATNTLDFVKVYEIRIRAYISKSKLYEAVEAALLVLRMLEIEFPENPGKVDLLWALAKIKIKMRGRSYASLIHLPPMHNKKIEAAIGIISSVGSATYFAYPNLFPLFVLKAFHLILEHGNSPYSGFVSASFGIIISGGLEDFQGGYQIGKVSQQLMDSYPLPQLKCRTVMIINSFLIHWNSHMREIFEPLTNAYKTGLETGDFEFASYCALVKGYTKLFAGMPLNKLAEEMQQYSISINQFAQKTPLLSNELFRQTVYNLLGESHDPIFLKGKAYDEDKELVWEGQLQSESFLFDFFICKTFLCYVFNEFEKATTFSLNAEKYLKSSVGYSLTREFYFYQSLSLLSSLKKDTPVFSKNMRIVRKNIRKLKKFAIAAPMNNNHKRYLVLAELNRVKGNSSKAAFLYEKSINLAKENQYVHEEALAYERAAMFHMEVDNLQLSEFYLERAYKTYSKWGAVAKMKHMEIQFSELFARADFRNSHLLKSDKSRISNIDESGGWDVGSIMKASMAISAEIRLDKLLEKLVRISIENTCAQKGFLILAKNSDLFIEAEGDVNVEKVVLHSNLSVKDNLLIPESIIQFVYATREVLILKSAMEDIRFQYDDLVKRKEVKSVLCFPVLNHGTVVSILYFENNLTVDAFNITRAELLKVLSGQIAVSIENAINEERKLADFKERERLLKKINVQQKLLTKSVIQTQEYERKRIAEDLHDGLGYLLSTLKLNLASLQQNGIEGNTYLSNSMSLLEESFKELKAVSNDLMPDVLFNYGLTFAVEDLCKRINNSGKLNIDFKYFNMDKKLKKDFEIEVFRIMQEIINNVLKHAEAANLEIQFVNHENQLVITAEDDGKGFDFKKTLKSKKKGKGLVNILNRVKFLSGSIEYENPHDRGTTIILHLPINY